MAKNPPKLLSENIKRQQPLPSLCVVEQHQAVEHFVKEKKITRCLYVTLVLVPYLKAHHPLAPQPGKEQHH